MATSRTVAALARTRPSGLAAPARIVRPINAAFFSSSSVRPATTEGPPPANFRLPKPVRWNEEKESTADKMGNYFLMTEMLRGMYVVLEQYFRPP